MSLTDRVEHLHRRNTVGWRTPLLVSAGATAFAAAWGGGGASTSQAIYLQLERPAWAPPPGLFGPVWTVLYLLLGWAAFQGFRAEPAFRHRFPLYRDFVAQAVLTAAWTWLFFRFAAGWLAALDSAAICLLLVSLCIRFWKRTIPAALLLVPAIVWTGFATALTVAITRLNPALQ